MLTVNGRQAVNALGVSAARTWRPFRGSKTVSPCWDGSGFTIRYDGTPNRSYAAFFLFRSMRAVLGDRLVEVAFGGHR